MGRKIAQISFPDRCAKSHLSVIGCQVEGSKVLTLVHSTMSLRWIEVPFKIQKEDDNVLTCRDTLTIQQSKYLAFNVCSTT